MGRTALNVTGDLVVTTVVAKKMKMVDLSKLEK
ncbi:MAG: dicarboxylate/amino acid:cation symporter [Treponema sp.]|nr:dicarboxylate/amino acid:cation symporter [Treponema sp.]